MFTVADFVHLAVTARAANWHMHRTLARLFEQWLHFLSWKRSVLTFLPLTASILNRYVRFHLKLSTFRRWRMVAMRDVWYQHMDARADAFVSSHLKLDLWNVWRVATKVCRIGRFCVLIQRVFTKHAFQRWCTEVRVERSLQRLLLVAGNQKCRRWLGRGLAALRENVLKIRDLHRRVAEANTLYERWLRARILRSWRENALDQRKVYRREQRADQLHRTQLLRRAWRIMLTLRARAVQIRTIAREALLQRKQQCVLKWLDFTHRRLHHWRSFCSAKRRRYLWLLSACFRHWVLFVRQETHFEHSASVQRLLRRAFLRRMTPAFQSWKVRE